MHQPLAVPRPSLYFTHEVHPPWLPSEHPGPHRCRVAIAGAGPAGLVTALELARHGVASVVLDSERQVSEGSRAIVFTRRTLEILHQVGIADRTRAAGLPWRFGNSYFRGQRTFRMEAPHDEDDRHGPLLNLQQPFLESFLIDACRAEPLIELRWGNRVVGVGDPAGESVRVEVDTAEGVYPLEADWLVAADGGRSPIRALLGLKMEGASYEGRFVIADIRIDLPLPTERLAYFDPPWNPGNTILMHREPHGIWRVDYQLPPGETPEEALRPESLAARIDAQLAMIGHAGTPWEMDWASVYSARTLTLPDYRHGRVLFAGDAAHLLPIFGVRGANTAFQDAQALGWRLAFVANGLAGPRLLDNYSAERVGAAREIIEEAGKSTRFMTPPTRGFRLLRDAVLSLSLTEAFVRPLYHWRTSRPHAYAGSMLNAVDDDDAAFDAGPGHGAPPADVRLGDGGFLLERLGGGFDLLVFVDGPAIPAAVAAAAEAERARGVPVRVVAIAATAAAGDADAAADPNRSPAPAASASDAPRADLVLPDPEGRARRRYGVTAPGAVYLMRPDQHVCGRWRTPDVARLRAAFARALPR